MAEKNVLCKNCRKNPATVSKKNVGYGGIEKEYYCQACYQTLFLTGDFLEDKAFTKELNGKKFCAFCGGSAEDFFKTGLVGCANCYKAFAKEIYPTILKLQGDRAHCGKTHYHSKRYARMLDERDSLRGFAGENNGESKEKLDYLIQEIHQSNNGEDGE